MADDETAPNSAMSNLMALHQLEDDNGDGTVASPRGDFVDVSYFDDGEDATVPNDHNNGNLAVDVGVSSLLCSVLE